MVAIGFLEYFGCYENYFDGENLVIKKYNLQENKKTNSSGAGLHVIYFTSNFSSLIYQPDSHGWFNTIKLSKHFLQINL